METSKFTPGTGTSPEDGTNISNGVSESAISDSEPSDISTDTAVSPSGLTTEQWSAAMTLLEDRDELWDSLPPGEATRRREIYRAVQESVVKAKRQAVIPSVGYWVVKGGGKK
jgi:hypothetical protein